MWFGVEVKNVILFLTAAKVKHGIDTHPMCFYTCGIVQRSCFFLFKMQVIVASSITEHMKGISFNPL